ATQKLTASEASRRTLIASRSLSPVALPRLDYARLNQSHDGDLHAIQIVGVRVSPWLWFSLPRISDTRLRTVPSESHKRVASSAVDRPSAHAARISRSRDESGPGPALST